MIRFAVLLGIPALCLAQSSPLVTILSQELDRNFQILKDKGDPAPYFLAYAVSERQAIAVSATLGALKAADSSHSRLLDVTVRVGSPKLDNYHRLAGERAQFSTAIALPLEDNAAAIQQRAWRETDRTYRLAAERLIKIRASREVKAAEEDDSDDFSREEPAVHIDPAVKANLRPEDWADRLRKWSVEFAKHRSILTSQVSLVAQRETKYLVNTEGTRLQHGRGFARIVITARGKAADGMDLATSESFEAEDPAGLPKDEAVRAGIERVARQLDALLHAPVVEPFAGPAILSGRAAAVFFHEIFGHRVEGHRQKDESEGQTFTKSVGAKVLPEFLSVIFDPTQRKFEDADLNGSYAYDDEGVKAQRVAIVEKGVLKSFLMSRSPIRGFVHSNGHGRAQPGREVVSRQSNMFVESAQAVPESKLRDMLIAEVLKQGKPYGLLFQEVTGGYTTTQRAGIQAFKVVPIVVFRVFPDGRMQLVRGADIVGTPLASFARILAASNQAGIFNGYCGAESGNVPVSAVAPAVLVSEIEIQKTARSMDRPPLLPAPVFEEGRP